MSDHPSGSERARQPVARRTVVVLTTGARLLILAGVLLAVFAVYLLLAPITRSDENGKTIDCGTLVNPPTTGFVQGLCGDSGDLRLTQTLAVAAAAVIVGLSGPLVFGSRRHEDTADE